MKKYEYNDITVNVPTGWDEVTVATYDRMWNLKPKTRRERAQVIAIACGVDLQVLLDWPTEVFNMILTDVGFLFRDNPAEPSPFVKIGDVNYHAAVETRLSFGEYIDVDAVQKEEEYASAIISNVLAIICRPACEKYDPDNNADRAAMFGALPVSQVQGVLAFFLRCYTILTAHTKLLDSLRATVDQLPRSIAPSLRNGASIKWSLIWPIIKYWILMRLLRARLRKFLPSYSTNAAAAPLN